MASTPTTGDDRYLARVVRVLESFDSELSVHRVGDIISTTGLPSATAYRIVTDLVAFGFLSRDADGRIRLGSRLWELANRGSPLTDLREAAHVEILGVHTATGFHTNLAVLREGSVLVVDRIVADTPLRNRSVPATRQSALRSSLGLAMLAHAPFAQLRLALALEHARMDEQAGGAAGSPDALLLPATRVSPVSSRARGVAGTLAERAVASADDTAEAADDADADAAAAAAEASAEAFADDERDARRTLERVRRLGHAMQRGQQDVNTMGVAVPVFGARGAVVAALGVVMPVESSASSEQAVAERLRLAAGRIGARLGRAGGSAGERGSGGRRESR